MTLDYADGLQWQVLLTTTEVQNPWRLIQHFCSPVGVIDTPGGNFHEGDLRRLSVYGLRSLKGGVSCTYLPSDAFSRIYYVGG